MQSTYWNFLSVPARPVNAISEATKGATQPSSTHFSMFIASISVAGRDRRPAEKDPLDTVKNLLRFSIFFVRPLLLASCLLCIHFIFDRSWVIWRTLSLYIYILCIRFCWFRFAFWQEGAEEPRPLDDPPCCK